MAQQGVIPPPCLPPRAAVDELVPTASAGKHACLHTHPHSALHALHCECSLLQ